LRTKFRPIGLQLLSSKFSVYLSYPPSTPRSGHVGGVCVVYRCGTTERCCHVYTRRLHQSSVNDASNHLKGFNSAYPMQNLIENWQWHRQVLEVEGANIWGRRWRDQRSRAPKVPSEAREARSAGAPRGWGLGRGSVLRVWGHAPRKIFKKPTLKSRIFRNILQTAMISSAV